MRPIKHTKSKGAILVLVLWIISISLVFISILAKNSRLSATIIIHQQQSLIHWSKLLNVINLAKAEILLKQKPTSGFGGGKKKQEDQLKYIFNGNKVTLSFPSDDEMNVRIYDLSGKLNLSNINKASLKKILEKKLVDNNEEIEILLDSWQDWIDKDNLKRLNGAEKKYYNTLNPSYSPRNGPMQSVNELNLIKGFEEAFNYFDFTKVFTLFGVKTPQVNPNIVNKETLLLIPGINHELADLILKTRQKKLFENIAAFNSIIPAAVAAKVNPWFAMNKSKFYAIVIYSKEAEKQAITNENGTKEIYVYKEIVHVLSNTKKPKTLRVYPSYKITF